jgi:hypothetical protein
MGDIEAWVAAAAGLLASAAGAINLRGLLRAQLRQRARVQLERERSERLLHLVRQARGTVRVEESDGDGHRVVEIERGGRDSGRDDRKAA